MSATFKSLTFGAILLGAAATLSGCGKKDASADTNVVEMNAQDGSMNDMTTVDSATLDAAGSANVESANVTDNAANAM